jgi:porphobilinogen deaminase
MALRQIAIVRDRLIAANPSELAETGAIEIVTVSTTGGRVQNRLLAEIGGKGLFAKEIEEALLAGDVDLAVHSLKDLETWLPDGLAIACVLPRDDRHHFIAAPSPIASASPRSFDRADPRECEHAYPQEGAGEIDGLVLALCNLERLDFSGYATEILPLGICCRRSVKARSLLSAGRPTR